MFRPWKLLAAFTLLGMLTGEGGTGRTVLRQEFRDAQPGTSAGAVSADGRHVAFVSSASLVAEDTNLLGDIYVLDRQAERLRLASVGPSGTTANGTSLNPDLNADGRYVAFDSSATSLTTQPDRNDASDVFVRDLTTGTTTRVTVGLGGQEANERSSRPAISADGRWVAFESLATNLVSEPDANGIRSDVYLTELATGAVKRISVDESGRQFAHAYAPRISGDGRFVAFAAVAVRPDPGVYLRDVIAGTTLCVSCESPIGARLAAFAPDLSADGSVVTFAVQNGRARSDIAVYDRASRTITVITRLGNVRSTTPKISDDGRVIAFESWASDLLCTGRCRHEDLDENLLPDVYLFERATGRFQRASGGRTTWWAPSVGPAIDGTGATVLFSSRQPFGPEDLTADFDLFVCSPVCS